jgi:hypothetical protein
MSTTSEDTPSFALPHGWQSQRLTDQQRDAVNAILAAFDQDSEDPWELRAAAEAAKAADQEPAPALVLIRATFITEVAGYATRVNFTAPDGAQIPCWVLPGLIRQGSADEEALTVVARRISEDDTIRIELFSPTDQYEIEVHKMTSLGPYPPSPETGTKEAAFEPLDCGYRNGGKCTAPMACNHISGPRCIVDEPATGWKRRDPAGRFATGPAAPASNP